jgi:hypothetical protein
MWRRVTQPPHIAGPLGGIARAKKGPVFSREFIVTHNFRSSIGTHSSANFVLKSPACPDTHLHMIIHGFAFLKFAKPAHEHHLQVSHYSASLALIRLPGLKKLRPPNGFIKFCTSAISF